MEFETAAIFFKFPNSQGIRNLGETGNLGIGIKFRKLGIGIARNLNCGARFVEEHYGDQLRALADREAIPAMEADLVALEKSLAECCADEVAHKDDANKVVGEAYSWVDSVHWSFVYWGSRVGAAFAKVV